MTSSTTTPTITFKDISTAGFIGYAVERFYTPKKEPEATVKANQADHHIKMIASLGPLPNTTEEANIDTYVDNFSKIVSRHRIPFDTAIPALISIQTPDIASVMNSIELSPDTKFESFFDSFIKLMCPASSYALELAQALLSPPRFATVLEASTNHRTVVSRYVRTIVRWSLQSYVTDAVIPTALLTSLPIEAEESLRIQQTNLTNVEKIRTAATIFEAARSRRANHYAASIQPGGPLRTVVGYGPPHHEPYETAHHKHVYAAPATPKPPSPCPRCGDDHWKKDCRYSNVNIRCRNCDETGHIAKVCQNTVERDTQGRITAKFKRTRRGNIMTTRKDVTSMDKLNTGLDVITTLRDNTMKLAHQRRAKNSNNTQRQTANVMSVVNEDDVYAEHEDVTPTSY